MLIICKLPVFRNNISSMNNVWCLGTNFIRKTILLPVTSIIEYNYVLQVSIDTLSWEFSVMTVGDENIIGPPKVSTL